LHSRGQLRITNLQAPATTSQILITSFQAPWTTSQAKVQTRTQLNASKSIGNQCEGQGGNRVGHSANDEESTNHWQRHGN
jgi:hypothetical protein